MLHAEWLAKGLPSEKACNFTKDDKLTAKGCKGPSKKFLCAPESLEGKRI